MAKRVVNNPFMPPDTYQNLREIVASLGPKRAAKRLGFHGGTVERLLKTGGEPETRVLRSTIAKIYTLARDLRTKNMPSGSLTDEPTAHNLTQILDEIEHKEPRPRSNQGHIDMLKAHIHKQQEQISRLAETNEKLLEKLRMIRFCMDA